MAREEGMSDAAVRLVFSISPFSGDVLVASAVYRCPRRGGRESTRLGRGTPSDQTESYSSVG